MTNSVMSTDEDKRFFKALKEGNVERTDRVDEFDPNRSKKSAIVRIHELIDNIDDVSERA